MAMPTKKGLKTQLAAVASTGSLGSIRSVPVVIEASSGSFDRPLGLTMEVCGSWSDNDYISCDEQEGTLHPSRRLASLLSGRLRESIADAMKDSPHLNERLKCAKSRDRNSKYGKLGVKISSFPRATV